MMCWQYAMVHSNNATYTTLDFSVDRGTESVAAWQRRYPDELDRKRSTGMSVVIRKAELTSVLGWLGVDGWEAVGLTSDDASGARVLLKQPAA
jgi:hypothetical protein